MKINQFLFVITFLLGAMGFDACAQKAGEHTKVLTVAEFKAKIAASPNAYIIDVRTPEEVSGGAIAGAQNIIFGSPNFKTQLDKLDKKHPILVYCAVGGRSGKTTPTLEALGFKEIYDLKGGYNAWSTDAKK